MREERATLQGMITLQNIKVMSNQATKHLGMIFLLKMKLETTTIIIKEAQEVIKETNLKEKGRTGEATLLKVSYLMMVVELKTRFPICMKGR